MPQLLLQLQSVGSLFLRLSFLSHKAHQVISWSRTKCIFEQGGHLWNHLRLMDMWPWPAGLQMSPEAFREKESDLQQSFPTPSYLCQDSFTSCLIWLPCLALLSSVVLAPQRNWPLFYVKISLKIQSSTEQNRDQNLI